MASLIISNSTTFGGMTNQVVGRTMSLGANITRLQEAIATASSGYEGTPGTEFETPPPNLNSAPVPNNFGVQADPDNVGANGQAYAYAVGQLKAQWDTFWAAAEPYIAALDNGVAF
jgi:hypothetical protein